MATAQADPELAPLSPGRRRTSRRLPDLHVRLRQQPDGSPRIRAGDRRRAGHVPVIRAQHQAVVHVRERQHAQQPDGERGVGGVAAGPLRPVPGGLMLTAVQGRLGFGVGLQDAPARSSLSWAARS